MYCTSADVYTSGISPPLVSNFTSKMGKIPISAVEFNGWKNHCILFDATYNKANDRISSKPKYGIYRFFKLLKTKIEWAITLIYLVNYIISFT